MIPRGGSASAKLKHDWPPEVQATKGKLDYTKIHHFASKVAVNRVKRQLMEWEKIFAKLLSDKGLIFRQCEELLQHNNKQPDEKLGNRYGWTVFQRRSIQLASRHKKRCLTSFIIREMQTKCK